MESDHGKVFIGGISWDTDEGRLRQYFGDFGEVVDAIIMKDRATGRSRGFGFIVFAEPAVAEQVVVEKHIIDGRVVEAKKAVPREDRSGVKRDNHSGSVIGSPGIGGTKKIFVGGLPSTLTESEFRNYFGQFGVITDVVVMYDQNTQRPRGFGFITFDSEDAVDKVLIRAFHELCGKMVEVKKAVPREQSPGPNTRSPAVGYSHGLSRLNGVPNGYNQGYYPSLIGGYGMRIDDRLGPLAGRRTGLSSFGPSGLGMGISLDPSLSPSFIGNSSLSSNLTYGRAFNPFFSGNSSRYNSAIGYGVGNRNNSSLFNSVPQNISSNGSNGSLSYGTNLLGSDPYVTSGSDNFGDISLNWSNSSISASVGGSSIGYSGGNLGNGEAEDNFGSSLSNFGRNGISGAANFSRHASNGGSQGSYANWHDDSSVYGNPTWRSSSPELENAGPFSYGLGNASTEITGRSTAGYMGGYNITNTESNRDR